METPGQNSQSPEPAKDNTGGTPSSAPAPAKPQHKVPQGIKTGAKAALGASIGLAESVPEVYRYLGPAAYLEGTAAMEATDAIKGVARRRGSFTDLDKYGESIRNGKATYITYKTTVERVEDVGTHARPQDMQNAKAALDYLHGKITKRKTGWPGNLMLFRHEEMPP